MNKLLFSLTLAATAGVLSAQEMGTAAAAPAAGTTVAAAVVVAQQDGGQAVVDTAVAKGPELVATPPAAQFVSADEQVQNDLAKMNLTEGYDTAKRAIIQIGSASIKVEDPANDPAFVIKREQIANYAYLNAKAEVIRAINSEFSAMDRACTFLDDSVDETAAKFQAKKAEVEAKKAELTDLLQKVDATEAQAVGEVTINDRFGALLDAVIKKIDETYDPAKIAADKQANAASKQAEAKLLKEKAAQLMAEYKELEAEAAKLPKDPALETASTAKLLSKMPLLGSSVITQAESWDSTEKTYTVAMAIVWSPKLQENAVKVCMGDAAVSSKKGKYSLKDWVAAQDFGCMVGPRRFTDDQGRNLFVGIAAADLKGPIVKQNAKKMVAETMARKAVAMSLLGDIEAYREASQNLKVYADDSAGASQKLADTVSAKVNLNLQGCMSIAKKTVINPIMGRKIYVAAYYVDPSFAKEAMGALKKLYADSVRVTKASQYRTGYASGAAANLKAVQNSTSVQQQAAAQAAVEVQQQAAKDSAAAAAAAKSVQPTARPSTGAQGTVRPASGGKSTGGTFSGGTIDTDF